MSVSKTNVLSTWLDAVVPGIENQQDSVEIETVDEMLECIKSIKHSIEQNKDALRL